MSTQVFLLQYLLRWLQSSNALKCLSKEGAFKPEAGASRSTGAYTTQFQGSCGHRTLARALEPPFVIRKAASLKGFSGMPPKYMTEHPPSLGAVSETSYRNFLKRGSGVEQVITSLLEALASEMGKCLRWQQKWQLKVPWISARNPNRAGAGGGGG